MNGAALQPHTEEQNKRLLGGQRPGCALLESLKAKDRYTIDVTSVPAETHTCDLSARARASEKAAVVTTVSAETGGGPTCTRGSQPGAPSWHNDFGSVLFQNFIG